MSQSPIAEIVTLAVVPKRAERVWLPAGIITWWDYLYYQWMMRPCFICGKFGKCRHREPDAESVDEFKTIKAGRAL